MKNPIDILMDRVEWQEKREAEEPVEGELPYVTHEGVLKIADIEIQVYQLSNGMRIIPEDELKRLGLLPLPDFMTQEGSK